VFHRLLLREPVETLPEPGGRAGIFRCLQNFDGAATDLHGFFYLTPVLVEHSESFVAERTGMTGLNSSQAVLDKDCEVRLVAAVLEMGLGERDVGKLEIFRTLGEIEGRMAQDTGEIELAYDEIVILGRRSRRT
jgi:hypothetical protein